MAGSTTPSGGVTEDVAIDGSGHIGTGGTITFQDLDLIDTHTASFVLNSTDATANLPGFTEGLGPGAAHIGTFAIDASVTESNTDTDNTGSLGWTFTLDDSNPVLQSLADGQTLTQVYTVTLTTTTAARSARTSPSPSPGPTTRLSWMPRRRLC